MEKLIEFICNDKKKTMLITGPAGSGKTFLIKEFIENFNRYNQNMSLIGAVPPVKRAVVTSTTHKATNVLLDYLRQNKDITFDYEPTLHSYLGLCLLDDVTTGKTINSFKSVKNTNANNRKDHVLIIDEATMIDDQLLALLLSTIDEYHLKKVIFIGDIAQLPPIKQNKSSLLNNIDEVVELDKIYRNTDASFNKYLRDKVLNNHTITYQDIVSNPNYTLSGQNDIIKHVEELFINNPNSDNKYIAFTNKIVNDTNKRIRAMNNYTPSRFELGESVTVERDLFYYIDNREHTSKKLMLKNGESIYLDPDIYTLIPHVDIKKEILGFKAVTEYFPEIPLIGYTFVRKDGLNIHCLYDDNDLIAFENRYKKMMQTANDFSALFMLKHSIAKLSNNYAITVHKSQGSTYNNTIIDIRSIINSPTSIRNKLLYVSLTRAKDKVIIYDSHITR